MSLSQRDEYNPYQPAPMLGTPDVEKVQSLRGSYRGPDGSSQHIQRHSNSSPPARRNFYWRLSDTFGFKEAPSLALFLILGGALLGFCLSRLMMFSPHIVEKQVVPGEWFWYSKKLYKPNIFIHIYTTTLGGLFSGIQFIPMVRRRFMTLHRINGYIVILFLVTGMATGAVVGRRAFGGELHTQAAFFTLAISISYSLLNGYVNIKRKDIQTHRKWMLRAMTYLSSVITARIIAHIAIEIITDIGTYYSIWSCEEIAFALGGENSTAYRQDYPQCTNKYILTFIRASTKATKLNEGTAIRCSFGMALWLGLFIHAIGVEVYLWFTQPAPDADQGPFFYGQPDEPKPVTH